MTLRSDLEAELDRRAGAGDTGPLTVVVQNASGVRVQADVAALEKLGCNVSQVLVSAPQLAGASTQTLRDWSDELARRITYLLESLNPLETDEDAGRVLMRSTAPHKLPSGREYYECMLANESHGNVSFRRYRSEAGVPGRTPVDMTLTRDVLGRLVGDLVETMP